MGRATGKELWAWRHEMRHLTEDQGIDPRELDWFLGWVSDLDSLTLKLGLLRQIPEVALQFSLQEMSCLWQQRLQERVPVQYLVGKTTWRDFTLQVSPSVLIPRPETELIVDLVVAAVDHSPQAEDLRQGTWVDMGTGSGAIALALALAFPQACIIAVDLSPRALVTARHNAASHGLADRITFLEGSWFAPLQAVNRPLSGLVANPPYIPTSTLATLQPEVIRHEPSTALDGGEDGLNPIRTLAQQAPDHLMSGGVWIVEMMAGQGEAVRSLLAQTRHYQDIQIHHDLAGLDRFALAFRQ